jgi:hypothetical protein
MWILTKIDFGAIRRRVTGATKTDSLEAMDKLRRSWAQAPSSSKSYTVRQAVDDWLAECLPRRSDPTRSAYRC